MSNLAEYVAAKEAREAAWAAEKAARKAQAALNDKAAFEATKVGDVFVSSWGYDQTNVDFYKVVAKTASRIKVVRIGSRSDYLGSGCDSVRPDKTREIGEVMTKQVRASSWRADFDPARDSYFKVASYANAHRWDGSARHETAHGWGH